MIWAEILREKRRKKKESETGQKRCGLKIFLVIPGRLKCDDESVMMGHVMICKPH